MVGPFNGINLTGFLLFLFLFQYFSHLGPRRLRGATCRLLTDSAVPLTDLAGTVPLTDSAVPPTQIHLLLDGPIL